MPAYVIAMVEVTDPKAYEGYRALAGPSIAAHGGRFVVRGGAATALEGAAPPGRLVVIEFASVEAAKHWYDSPDYLKARQARANAAKAQLILVEGVAPA